MRVAHELAQNDLVVVYFSVMLPEQVLGNSDALGYFDSVHFLCLTAPHDVLRARITRQAGSIPVSANIDAWRSGAGGQLPAPGVRPGHPGRRPRGIDLHRLRHSAGHIMRAAGVPLEVIQRRLGHASIRTTADVYGSLPESIDRAVADQLDDIFHPSCGADVVQGGDSTGSG